MSTTFSLREEMSKCAENNELYIARHNALQAAVKQHGDKYVVRDDSRLAWIYISQPNPEVSGNQFWSLGSEEEILRRLSLELVAMQSLYNQNYTRGGDLSGHQYTYRKIQEDKLRELAEWAKATHPTLNWKKVWQIVRDTGTPIVKLMACQQLASATVVD